MLSSLVLALALALAIPAHAQTSSEGADGFLPDYPDPVATRREGPGLVDVGLKLAFVLGLVYAASLAWKRFGRPMGQSTGDEVIRLWTQRSLGLGSEMYLVEIGDRMLLVGRSGSQLATLTEFDDPAVIDQLKATCVVPLALTGGHWLDRWRRREERR